MAAVDEASRQDAQCDRSPPDVDPHFIHSTDVHGPWLPHWWEEGQQQHDAHRLAASITVDIICSTSKRPSRGRRMNAPRSCSSPASEFIPVRAVASGAVVADSSVTGAVLSSFVTDLTPCIGGVASASPPPFKLSAAAAEFVPSSRSVTQAATLCALPQERDAAPLMQLFVRSHFQQASMSVEVHADATIEELSVALVAALQQQYPVLTRLQQLTPARMVFMHSARRFAGADPRRCSDLGVRHGDSLQLVVEGVRGLLGGMPPKADKRRMKRICLTKRAGVARTKSPAQICRSQKQRRRCWRACMLF